MIRFYPPLIHEGETVFTSNVPQQLQKLLLKDFEREFAKGPWGYYLNQELKIPECSCEITYFNVKENGQLYPTPAYPMFCLHHVLKSSLSGNINGSVPVFLGEDWSHFFYLPPDIGQKAFFKKSPVISIHFNYTLDFIKQNLALFPFLQQFIDQHEADPVKAIFLGPVQHNYITRHAWKKFYSDLKTHNNPARLVSVMSRELLVKYSEGLEKKIAEAVTGSVKPGHLAAIHKAKEIIEKDFSRPNTYKQLSAAVGLNVLYLKNGFKKAYGISIHQHVISCRMDFAYHMILSTHEPIQNIAEMCGYENSSHFDIMFKKWFKVLPNGLRGKY